MRPRPSVLSVLFACTLSSTGALSPEKEWTSLGPEGGGFDFLAIDPQKPGVIYAASGSGQVSKTIDGGMSWKALPFTDAGVGVLVINPQQSSTLYAGTRGRGIYRSTDAGASWETANSGLPDGGYVLSLVLDPQTPATLYAVIYWNGYGWLLEKSTDGGRSWSEPDAAAPFKNEPLRWSFGISLTVDPHNPGTLYLGIGDVDYGGGLFKSTNGGKNWARAPGPDGSWGHLVFDPKIQGIVYARFCEPSGDVCTLLKSTDAGANWNEIALPDGWMPSLTIDPENTSILYAAIVTNSSSAPPGSGNVFKTIDAGASWTTLYSGPVIWSLVPDPHVTGTVFALTQTGILRSRDSGANWTPVNSGLVATVISALAIDPQFPNTLYAATSYKGSSLAKSGDGGKSWIPAGAGLPEVRSLAIDAHNPSTLYAITSASGGVFKTTDGGMNWSSVNEGLPGFPTTGPLALDPQNPNTIYVAAGGFGSLYKSTDGAASWTQVNTGPGNQDLRPAPIWGISIDPADPAIIYLLARHSNFPVFKSTDGGKNFSPAITGLPAFGSVGPLAIDPQKTSTLYVCVPGANMLFQSTDGATSWTPLKPGLPADVTVTNLLIDPQQPSTLYAASTRGVWKSTDSGRNWNPVNAGLTTLFVYQLAIDPQNTRRLFAGSSGAGVFTITFDAGTVAPSASSR